MSSLQFRSVAQNFRNPHGPGMEHFDSAATSGKDGGRSRLQGNHQSHPLFQPDQNACPTVFTTNSAITCNSLRPYPDIGSISGTATFGFGNYDAMIASLQKRMSAGLTFQAAYTYGHALANSGTTLSGSNGLYAYKSAQLQHFLFECLVGYPP